MTNHGKNVTELQLAEFIKARETNYTDPSNPELRNSLTPLYKLADQNNTEACLYLGLHLYHQGQLDDARARLEQAKDLGSAHAPYYLWKLDASLDNLHLAKSRNAFLAKRQGMSLYTPPLLFDKVLHEAFACAQYCDAKSAFQLLDPLASDYHDKHVEIASWGDLQALVELASKEDKFLIAAANRGSAYAQRRLGSKLLKANRQDLKGLSLLEQHQFGAPAEHLFLLGEAYEHRFFVSHRAEDELQALQQYYRAYKLGHAQAENKIGLLAPEILEFESPPFLQGLLRQPVVFWGALFVFIFVFPIRCIQMTAFYLEAGYVDYSTVEVLFYMALVLLGLNVVKNKPPTILTRILGLPEHLPREARQGDIHSQFLLGSLLATENNYKEAVPWLEKAAAAGHRQAQFEYGRLIHQQFPDKAIELWKEAARNGHVEAAFQLHESNHDPDNTMLLKAVTAHHPQACIARAFQLIEKHQNQAAIDLLYIALGRSTTADAELHYHLGLLLETSNPRQAQWHYTEAAEKWHPLALHRLIPLLQTNSNEPPSFFPQHTLQGYLSLLMLLDDICDENIKKLGISLGPNTIKEADLSEATNARFVDHCPQEWSNDFNTLVLLPHQHPLTKLAAQRQLILELYKLWRNSELQFTKTSPQMRRIYNSLWQVGLCFSDLTHLSPPSFQTLYQNCDKDILRIALIDCHPKIWKRFSQNLSQRAQEDLKRQIDGLSSSLVNIQNSQANIIALAISLHNRGKLKIPAANHTHKT